MFPHVNLFVLSLERKIRNHTWLRTYSSLQWCFSKTESIYFLSRHILWEQCSMCLKMWKLEPYGEIWVCMYVYVCTECSIILQFCDRSCCAVWVCRQCPVKLSIFYGVNVAGRVWGVLSVWYVESLLMQQVLWRSFISGYQRSSLIF